MPPRTKRVSDDEPIIVTSKPITRIRVTFVEDHVRTLLVHGTVEYVYQMLRDGVLIGWWAVDGFTNHADPRAWGAHVAVPVPQIMHVTIWDVKKPIADD